MKSITTYRILAVLLGFTGAHNFYFQYKRRAIRQLAISVLSLGLFIPIAWVLALYDIATVSHENMEAHVKDGKTPLQIILLNGAGYSSDSVARLADELINGGVDLEMRSAEGETALHMVARNAGRLSGDACEHIMRSLLNAGANPGATNAQKKTALQIVLRNEGNIPSIVCERLARALVRATGQKKVNPTMSLTQKLRALVFGKLKSASSASPLTFEAISPDTAPLWLLLHNEGKISGPVVRRLVRLILKAGAAPDLINSRGERPLQFLAKEPENICSYISRDIVQYLVEFGADTRIRDKAGNTPLHQAAAIGNFVVVEQLLRCGASSAAENNKKQKPEELTQSLLVKGIFAAGIKPTKLVKAAS